MGTLLYIKANSKPTGVSRTFKISDAFIYDYSLNYPDDDITTLDLYEENIEFLSGRDISNIFGPKNDQSKHHPILKYAYQFLNADKYVIAAPMWNLSIPAILKAYLDYVCVTGITFRYTENGSVGLCTGKKALYIVTRGGDYSNRPFSDFEMGEKYLKAIFAFLGITDFKTISADKLDIVGENVDAILAKAVAEAKKEAANFGERALSPTFVK